MRNKNAGFKKKLKQILKAEPDSLRAEVASEALEHQDIGSFFTDLLTYGCQSGMIGKLIYYYDTHKFYDAHYDEIESIRKELESALGESMQVHGDLKNWYAWMAFEETARIIADELELA